MSDFAARSAIARMNTTPVMIAATYAGFASDLQALAGANQTEQERLAELRRADLCMAYGLSPMPQTKPFAFSSGVAIIPVHGTLINRFGYSWGFVTGYNYIRQMTAAAGLDPDVIGIIYDHNSYGGEAAGCFECAADISRLANGKPTVAIVDSNCYSASYAMACGADRIVVTPSGGAGSVGVVAMHVSMEKLLKDWGIKITFIHAGAHKVDGNPFEDLPANVKADIQKGIDKSYAAFTAHVAKGRKMDEKEVRATEARIYRADDALSLGLIDAVQTPNEAALAFLAELLGSTSQPRDQEEDEMSTTTTTPGATTDAPNTVQLQADAATAERARVSGILNCDAAKGREKLANHLAFNTSMSVADATLMLNAADKAAVAADAPAGADFKAAMDATGNPNVGADTKGGGNGAPATGASSILAAAKAAGVVGFE